MTDLSKVTLQQYEQYCLNFHLSPCVLPAELIERYRSCCKILELEPGSNSEAIRNAYIRLSKVRHPDKQSGSTAAMLELVQAKKMLSGYIDLSDGKCDQPLTSLKVRSTTSMYADLGGDLRSFSSQRMMTLRVVTVLARQRISIAKFANKDFFATKLHAIDEAFRKLLVRMRELLDFHFNLLADLV